VPIGQLIRWREVKLGKVVEISWQVAILMNLEYLILSTFMLSNGGNFLEFLSFLLFDFEFLISSSLREF